MNQSSMKFEENGFLEGIEIIKNAKNNFIKIFEEENANIEKINNTEIWYGEADQKLYSKYQELRQNYEGIEESLEYIINFLESVAINHTNLEKVISNNISTQENNLDVNG